MFKFLKDKLKATVEKFSKKVDQEGQTQIDEKPYQPPSLKEEIGHATPLAQKEEEPPITSEEEIYTPRGREELVENDEITPLEEAFMEGEVKAEESLKAEPEKSFFSKIKERFEPKPEVITPRRTEDKGLFEKLKEKVVTKKIDEEKFEELFTDMEMTLLENNVAMEVIEKIKDDLKKEIVDTPIKRGQIEETIITGLKKSIASILDTPGPDFLKTIHGAQKPFVIAFVGINGSGKTTSIAKIAHYLIRNNLTVVLAAADTFRAAAIDQLEHHANKLGVKIIKHDYGSDPAAVAFDAIAHAKAKQVDVVLIDTAGRLHSNTNLIDEMKKIMRVAKPHLKLFIGEAITGNDVVLQATQFNDAIGIDGVILSKADIDEKGGAFLSVGYVTKKPILFVGVGQDYGDLEQFDKELIMQNLGLEEL